MMVSATESRSLKVSISSLVPLGRPSRRNMSSQWSWDRCSPRTYFSTGARFYTMQGRGGGKRCECTRKKAEHVQPVVLGQRDRDRDREPLVDSISLPTRAGRTLYLSTSACSLTDMVVG